MQAIPVNMPFPEVNANADAAAGKPAFERDNPFASALEAAQNQWPAMQKRVVYGQKPKGFQSLDEISAEKQQSMISGLFVLTPPVDEKTREPSLLDMAEQENPADAIGKETNHTVVSILEGDPVNPAMDPGMARMPEETAGPLETAEDFEGTKKDVLSNTGKTDSAENDSLCPLENKNDEKATRAANDTQNFNLHDEDPGEDATPAKHVPTAQTAGSKTEAETGKQSDTHPPALPVEQMVNVAPEKIAAAEDMRTVSAGTQQADVKATADTLFEKMVEQIEASKSSDGSRMEIQLKPDFLGKVSIHLSMTDDGLSARIQTEDMSVKNLIGGQITQLIESLSEKGIKVSAVDVVYTGVSDQNFDHAGARRQQAEDRKSSRNIDKIGRLIDFQPTPAPLWGEPETHVMDAAVSTVEYRA